MDHWIGLDGSRGNVRSKAYVEVDTTSDDGKRPTVNEHEVTSGKTVHTGLGIVAEVEHGEPERQHVRI